MKVWLNKNDSSGLDLATVTFKVEGFCVHARVQYTVHARYIQ